MKVYVVVLASSLDDDRNVIGVARDIDGAKLIADTMRDHAWTWPHDWEQIYNGCIRRVSSRMESQEIEEWDLV